MNQAYDYIIDHRINLTKDYPYSGFTLWSCYRDLNLVCKLKIVLMHWLRLLDSNLLLLGSMFLMDFSFILVVFIDLG